MAIVYCSVEPAGLRSLNVLELVGRVLAGLGAGMILAALTFVTLLIGVLVTAMVALIAGPVIDKLVKERA
jgi:hypothetical protein